MDKKYIDPKVNFISGDTSNAGMYTWMKSRKEIIKDHEGNTFMKGIEYDFRWQDHVPTHFYVGDEVVNFEDYKVRINSMNLQYNNLENYVFEIQGSCLFRDLLFNVNSISQWATSNRFLFSILDEEAVYDSTNYLISSEYKGIESWEKQFEEYMEAIKKDSKVDNNRLKMPYSISSYFWVSVSKSTLMSFLSMLKLKMPFFYKHYGHLFLKELDWKDEDIKGQMDTSVTQYFRDDRSEIEDVQEVGNYYHVNSKMALILYSQFIRQSSTSISGYYDILEHEDIDEFSSKVFSGETTFMISYMAHRDKVKSTIKNRLCAFAMSSGDSPASWNYFLNNFIAYNTNLLDFKRLLPCEFHKKGGVKYCKFYDDIKFRNEGKERSNVPCPLINLDIEVAQEKASIDNNAIGYLFHELTWNLRNGGLSLLYDKEYWTSKLQIYSDRLLKISTVNWLENFLSNLEPYFNQYDKLDRRALYELKPYLKYGIGKDITCMMKGYAIDKIREKLLLDEGHESFLINFGGDIFGYNTNALIEIEGTNVDLSMKGTFSVFTSGNTKKRGNHIVGGVVGEFSTTVVRWLGNADLIDNIYIDILSTKHFAKEKVAVNEIIENLEGKVDFIDFDKDSKIKNKTYCASPFFNPKQIQVRDEMISHFTNVFRPDLTESSKEYDKNKNEFAPQVVEDNIQGIVYSEFLTFPNMTDDLGTLFEVGIAIYYERPVIKYNNHKLTFTFPEFDSVVNPSKAYLFDCSDKRNVVSMGYLSQNFPEDKIYYQLKGHRDNIMLSIRYKHVELIDGKYVLIERDENERDN